LIAAGWQRFAYYSVLALPILLAAAAVRRIPLLEDAPDAEQRHAAASLKPAE
jgi:hypothetical protein